MKKQSKLKKSSTDASEKEASSKEKSKEKKKPLTSFQSKFYTNPTFDKKGFHQIHPSFWNPYHINTILSGTYPTQVNLFWIYFLEVKQFHKSLKGITADSLTGLSPDLSNLSQFLVYSLRHYH